MKVCIIERIIFIGDGEAKLKFWIKNPEWFV